MKHNTILVGIAGASASGKSLLAETLVNELKSEQLCVISEDSYYKDQSHLSMDQRVLTNYDHPSSMDHDLMLEHMMMLKNGEAVNVPTYDYTQHNRTAETCLVKPARVVIYEGILLFTSPAIREAFDLRFFMDTPLDMCLIRRLTRDILSRGRDVDSVTKQYLETVRPMYLQYIKPSRQYADMIIPHGGKNRIAIDLITTKVRNLID